jgi:ankyrin repeat domain-containing protein 13
VKEKNFKGSVHLSKDFPLKLVDFLPIAEVLAPTNRGFQKFADFVRMKLPDDGFPVKLELPVFPTVTGLATFSLFEEKQPDEFAADTFVVPLKYKRTKIRFRKGKDVEK